MSDCTLEMPRGPEDLGANGSSARPKSAKGWRLAFRAFPTFTTATTGTGCPGTGAFPNGRSRIPPCEGNASKYEDAICRNFGGRNCERKVA